MNDKKNQISDKGNSLPENKKKITYHELDELDILASYQFLSDDEDNKKINSQNISDLINDTYKDDLQNEISTNISISNKEFNHKKNNIINKPSKNNIIDNTKENKKNPFEDFDLLDEFNLYNELYFEGKLCIIIVEWSKKMTLCAGTFQVKEGLPLIRLSEPLLKYREIKEVRETLIHEMIHAYNYVKNHDMSDDSSGHGVHFKEKMNQINNNSEFNITVYHNFIDEVDFHRNHVWRCDGPCQNKPPFFGYVKRSMNRVPSKNDKWWDLHLKNCGGTFEKIAEPQKKKKNKEIKKKNDLKENQKNLSILKMFEKIKDIKKIKDDDSNNLINKKIFDKNEEQSNTSMTNENKKKSYLHDKIREKNNDEKESKIDDDEIIDINYLWEREPENKKKEDKIEKKKINNFKKKRNDFEIDETNLKTKKKKR